MKVSDLVHSRMSCYSHFLQTKQNAAPIKHNRATAKHQSGYLIVMPSCSYHSEVVYKY
jgi:hypothetical protein